jgi:hypothetical protein
MVMIGTAVASTNWTPPLQRFFPPHQLRVAGKSVWA